MCNYVIRTTVNVPAIGGIMCLLGEGTVILVVNNSAVIDKE